MIDACGYAQTHNYHGDFCVTIQLANPCPDLPAVNVECEFAYGACNPLALPNPEFCVDAGNGTGFACAKSKPWPM